MKSLITSCVLAALACFAPLAVSAADAAAPGNPIFLKMTGTKSGDFPGEVTSKGHEGLHAVLAFNHEAIVPHDAVTGQATGKRQEQPFRIVKLVNRSSPQLLNALASNENFPLVEMTLWTPAPNGVESKLVTYRLTNAHLVDFRTWLPNQSDPAAKTYPASEELAFTYQKIEIIHVPSGAVGSDSSLLP